MRNWFIFGAMVKHAIGEAEALQLYLTMGNDRSIPKMRALMIANNSAIIPPSIPTLKRWSARGSWAEAVKRHEITIKEEGIKEAISQTVSSTKERLEAYNEVLNLTTDNILNALKSANVQVNNAQDMTAHINTIEKLQKLLQLMQGEATEITENKTDNKNLFDSIDFNSLFEKKLN